MVSSVPSVFLGLVFGFLSFLFCYHRLLYPSPVYPVLCPPSLVPGPLPLYAMSHVPYPMSPVPCPISHVRCPLSPTLCPLSPTLFHMSPVPYPMSQIPCSFPLVPYHLSPTLCPLSPVPYPVSQFPCSLPYVPYRISTLKSTCTFFSLVFSFVAACRAGCDRFATPACGPRSSGWRAFAACTSSSTPTTWRS